MTLAQYGAKKGEKFNSGYVVGIKKRVKIPEFLNPEYKIDFERYMNKFFGKENSRCRSFSSGSIGNLLYSIFCFDDGHINSEKQLALSRIINGKEKKEDRALLLSKQMALF